MILPREPQIADLCCKWLMIPMAWFFRNEFQKWFTQKKLPRKDGYIAYQPQWQNFVPAKYPRIHHFTEFATCQACENSCLQSILFYHSVFTNHTCCHFDFFCILFCDTWGAIASHQDFGFTGLILYDLMAGGLPTTTYFTVWLSLRCIQSCSAYCFSISGS